MRRRAFHIFGVAVLVVYLWPLLLAVWTSFSAGSMLDIPTDYSLRWYREFFDSIRWRDALWESVYVGMLSATLAVAAGFGLAVGVVRRKLRAARWLSAIALIPMFVPAVVLGMALLPVVRLTGIWGTSWSVAAAHAVWTLPVTYLVLRDALADLNPQLEWAARGLGATPIRAFIHVALPAIAPSLFVAATVAFVLSVNEFVIALFLTTPQTETLPKVIWPNLRYTLTPIVSAASGVSMAFAVAAAGTLWLFRRRSILNKEKK